MAVTQAPPVTVPPLICLSSDSKPSGLAPGHLAYETDTGAWYIYNGSGWVTYSGPGPQTRESISLAAQGLISQAFDRANLAGGLALTSGTTQFILMPFFAGQVVTSLTVYMLSPGTTLTMAKLGLYDTSGNLLAATADVDSDWESGTGVTKTVDLTAPYTIPATGGYYGACLVTGSVGPTIGRGYNAGGQGVIGTGVRRSAQEASQTDLDATATLANSSNAIWMAAS